ncbi:MAG: hypothetical protein QM790_01350 [Nibricoccus sp.]
MPARPSPKPWSMKWIVIAILVFIVGYTFITLRFRKPGRSYEPYQNAKDRATVHRLEQAGYQRIPASVTLPADSERSIASLPKPTATHQNTAGGLPAELAQMLTDAPSLPEGFTKLTAPAVGNTLLPYAFQFTCRLPNQKSTLGETFVYVKDDDIAIVASSEKIGGQLEARSRDYAVLVTIPSGTLKPGKYRVHLIGSQSSREWSLQIQ